MGRYDTGDCCDYYICRKGSRWDEEKKRAPKSDLR